jgi:hypothetical protein
VTEEWGTIMGLLFTTEGTRRVINTLNTAFDGPDTTNKTGLYAIRQAASTAPKFYAKVKTRVWKAGHVAKMLSLFPYDQGESSGGTPGKTGQLLERDTKRWHYFLKTVVGPAEDAVFKPLRNALADAITNQDSNGNALNIMRVSFDHVELESANANPNIVIFDAPLPGTTGMVRHITLFTAAVPQKDPNGNSLDGTPFDANDNDEQDFPNPPWIS